MDKKQLLMLGGTILAGGAVFFVMSHNSGNQNVAASPAESLDVPTMPVANITPSAFNITDAPTYQTINFPTNRNLIPPPKPIDGDGCGCGGDCENRGIGVGASLSNDQLSNWTASVRALSERV